MSFEAIQKQKKKTKKKNTPKKPPPPITQNIHFRRNIQQSFTVQLCFFYLWCLCLVCFDGISTIVSYLMPNPVFTYILNI